MNRFPDSAYARDARLKIDLVSDHLAGKEMDIGRWYRGPDLAEAAIGGFQQSSTTTRPPPTHPRRCTGSSRPTWPWA